MGTAVNVQAMVFGNMGEDSGTGVLFSRDPATGANVILGEYLPNAQGEDVVAGIRTPISLNGMLNVAGEHADLWCEAHSELMSIVDVLEEHYRDMMDIEFTVQQGKLWMLQCRVGKRSALAAFKIARQFADEGLITKAAVFERLTAEQYKLVRLPRIADGFAVEPHAVGKGACPGVVTGKPVFSAQDAVNCTEPCILVTHETNPDDIAGMVAAAGILTQTGGSTSHAAVVARAMDKPCIVGCTELDIALMKSKSIKSALHKVTIDGSTGRVWMDVDVPLVNGAADPDVQEICRWALQVAGKALQATPGADHLADGDPDMPIRIMVADFWGHLGKLEDLLNILAGSGHLHRVALDLTHPHLFEHAEDLALLRAFSDLPESKAGFLAQSIKLIASKADVAGLTVISDELDKSEIEALAGAGIKVGRTPATLAGLLNADAALLTQQFVTEVIGGPTALAELQAVFAAAQKPIRVIPPAAPVDYVVFDLLVAVG
jgi:phosphohistidine swiveling domain-containing protein